MLPPLPLLLALALPTPAESALTLPTGPAPGALGVSHDDQASPEGPGSLAVDPEGRAWVLDAVHGRVAVFDKSGSLVASVPLPSDTIEDLALLPSGDLAVLDRLVARRVFVLASNGAVLASAPVEGAGIDDGGLVTGLFADEAGVWLEVLHGEHVRVLDGALGADGGRRTRPGLPLGAHFVRLRKVGDAAQILFFDAAGTVRADGVVDFSSLLELSGLVVQGTAAAATLWVAGHELVEGVPGAPPVRDRIVVVRVERGHDGRLRQGERRELRASPEFVPLKQLVAAGPGRVAHLVVDTRPARDDSAVQVRSW